jgi:hypothetical protein
MRACPCFDVAVMEVGSHIFPENAVQGIERPRRTKAA